MSEQVKILWQDHGYTDFEIEGYNLIFRIWERKFDEYLEDIKKNLEFFKYFEQEGFNKICNEVKVFANWGNGWEWQERTHKKLAEDYRLGYAVSWYTLPYGRSNPSYKSMQVYNIESKGFELKHSYNHNRQPQDICYCFRKQ